MPPISDFNFMVTGIATFATTVGYSYASYKFNPTTESRPVDNIESKNERISEKDRVIKKDSIDAGPLSSTSARVPTRWASLKRKEPHDGFDEDDNQNLGYPHNLANIYPRKRCRPPSPEKDEIVTRQFTPLILEDPAINDWALAPNIEPPRTPSPGTGTASPATEGTKSPLLEMLPILPVDDGPSQKVTFGLDPAETGVVALTDDQSPIRRVPNAETESRAIEPSALNGSESSPFRKASTFTHIPSFQKISLQKSITPSFTAHGFADFAMNQASFNTFSTSQAMPQRSSRPVWLAQGDDISDDSGRLDIKENVVGQALAKATSKSTAKPITNRVTGEENEDVEMELNSVKLYIKRGDKPFTEGIVGHFKLLKDRTTLDERLLFRREPLWKISINARVNRSLRCSFDPTDNTLRIVTQEPRTDGFMTSACQECLEIVIYAMKPGRSCSEHDFKVFAEALIKNSRLKSSSSS